MISKDNEFKTVLQLASEQAKIEQKMNALKEQVELQVGKTTYLLCMEIYSQNRFYFGQDREINKLQKQLKEAEHMLSTAIFQARQKLASIEKANKRPVSSEELIKYAHKYDSPS